MSRAQKLPPSVNKARKRPSERHTCYCGRTLHNNQHWNEHKQKCPSWDFQRERK